MPDYQALFAQHRPELLRHCYRMMGSFADAEDLTQDALMRAWEARNSFRGEGPLRHWLLTIATNACLNALAGRRRLELPQGERPPSPAGTPPEELESSRWLTPAPDARLFPDPHQSAERRESVALAFLAALQRLPSRQRAVLLLKDVVGLPAEAIAEALELTVPSVNSALHRAREAAGEPPAPSPEPPPEVLREYVRCWEERDLDRLTALLREDVVLAMPPHAVWFRGAGDVAAFLRTPRFQSFWSPGVRIALTRANGLPALGFYSARDGYRLHSVGATRFEGGRVAELTVFIGPHFLHGFDLPGTTAQFPEPSLS
jgi:RNA polymerase sigma-70 factor (ECF subfamily)